MESKLTQLLDAYETGKIGRRSFVAMLCALFVTPAMGSSPQGFSAKSLNHVTLRLSKKSNECSSPSANRGILKNG